MKIIHINDEISSDGSYLCRLIRTDGPTMIFTQGTECFIENDSDDIRFVIHSSGNVSFISAKSFRTVQEWI